MQWEQFMRQFADVVGRALARRWLAKQLASGKQRTETGQDMIAKEEDCMPRSRRSEDSVDDD